MPQLVHWPNDGAETLFVRPSTLLSKRRSLHPPPMTNSPDTTIRSAAEPAP
jgi:hypothetical protein